MTSGEAITEATQLTQDALDKRRASIQRWADGYEMESKTLAADALLSATCATALMLTHGIVLTAKA